MPVLWKKIRNVFQVFPLQEGKKIFLLKWEHLNFTCTFRGTMKRISREFYGDLSGNRCTKVAPLRSSRLSVYLEIFPTVVDQCVIVKAGK